MDVGARLELIRELCSFGGRLAGTDAERRAAGLVAARLREGGRRAEIEPIYVHPQYGLVHAAHCLLGFAGSLVGVAVPALGFAMVLLAATSMYLDLDHRLYLLRRLFFRRASQNVLARGSSAAAPARVLLCAHVDSARTGAAFDPRRVRRAAWAASRLPFPSGPFRVLFWSLAFLLPVLGARMAGIEAPLLSLLQLPPTLILLLGVFALVDIELSEVSPGANDDASGVAAVLGLARELERDPPQDLDVWVLVTGGEECLQEGMRAFVRAHREDLDPGSTFFIALDTLGHGTVRYETSAGWAVGYEMDRRLVELCEAIATADRERGDRFGARPLARGTAGDSVPPRLYGFRSIGITCLGEEGYVPHKHTLDDVPERIDPGAVERAEGFVLELVRQLDRDVGRRARVSDPARARASAARGRAELRRAERLLRRLRRGGAPTR